MIKRAASQPCVVDRSGAPSSLPREGSCFPKTVILSGKLWLQESLLV